MESRDETTSGDPTTTGRDDGFTPARVPRVEAVDLTEVVDEVRESLERTLPPNIRLRVDTSRRLPAARADRVQVELMLAHLAAAAREAMAEGGTLTLRTYAGDVGIVLEAEHTGDIDARLLPRLFEPLSAGAPSGALRLALATVQALAFHNHGTLRVESTSGGGMRVAVALPPMREAQTDPRALRARGAETILVVEDEDAVRAVVRRTLEKAGYTILQAADPLVALDILARRKEQVDLLLSDIFMHHMRGTELVRRVREQWPLVRVLYMSGYGHDPVIMEEVTRDGALLVPKPFTNEELLTAVRRALDALPGSVEEPMESSSSA